MLASMYHTKGTDAIKRLSLAVIGLPFTSKPFHSLTNLPTTSFPTTSFPTTSFPTTSFPTTSFQTTRIQPSVLFLIFHVQKIDEWTGINFTTKKVP